MASQVEASENFLDLASHALSMAVPFAKSPPVEAEQTQDAPASGSTSPTLIDPTDEHPYLCTEAALRCIDEARDELPDAEIESVLNEATAILTMTDVEFESHGYALFILQGQVRRWLRAVFQPLRKQAAKSPLSKEMLGQMGVLSEDLKEIANMIKHITNLPTSKTGALSSKEVMVLVEECRKRIDHAFEPFQPLRQITAEGETAMQCGDKSVARLLKHCSPQAARLLSVLAYLPSGVNPHHVPSLLDDFPRVTSIVIELHYWSLIQLPYDSSNSRLVINKDIRSYVSENYPIRPEDQKRIETFYFHLISSYSSSDKDADRRQFASMMLEEEANMEQVILEALRVRPVSANATAAAIELLVWFLPRNSFHPELVEETLCCASQLNRPDVVGRCLQGVAEKYIAHDRFEDALERLEKAIDEFSLCKDCNSVAQCLQMAAEVFIVLGRFEEAMAKSSKAKEEFDAIGNLHGTARCLDTQGIILHKQLKFNEALLVTEEARKALMGLEDRMSALQCQKRIGCLLITVGRSEEALVVLNATRTCYVALGMRKDAAECLILAAEVFFAMKHFDAAIKVLDLAKQEFELGRWNEGASKAASMKARVILEMQAHRGLDGRNQEELGPIERENKTERTTVPL